ncbi:MAG: cytochrome P450 [Actinomycetota bacterium]|nr:cytochrome P450 [Actinomycetota bacterium]
MRSLLTYENNGSMDVACPWARLVEVARDTPVVRWEMGVGFFSMADVVSVGNHPAVVSANPITHEPMGMGSREPLIPLHLDGDVHRHYRKLIDPLFAPRQVALFEEGFRHLADELIDGFIADGEVDFVAGYAVPLPATMFMQIFGAPMDDLPFFTEMKDRILKAEGLTIEEREAEGRLWGDRLRVRLAEIVAERRAATTQQDDLISKFLSWEVEGDKLSDEDIVNVMHLFVIAGLDTVTSSIGCLIGWLAANPEQRRQLFDDPSLVPHAVEELMRHQSPVNVGGPRWATEDFEVNGVSVKQGDMLLLGWWTANLDPAVFADPLTVDFTREANRHAAFAAGRHRCLGSHLARLELRIAIEQFHRRVSDYSLAPGAEPAYKWEGVRSPVTLPLIFAAR